MSGITPAKRLDLWLIWRWAPATRTWSLESVTDSPEHRDRVLGRLRMEGVIGESRRMISCTPPPPAESRQYAVI